MHSQDHLGETSGEPRGLRFEILPTHEGFELTIGPKIYVYPTLKKVLDRIEKAVNESAPKEEKA